MILRVNGIKFISLLMGRYFDKLIKLSSGDSENYENTKIIVFFFIIFVNVFSLLVVVYETIQQSVFSQKVCIL